MKNLKSKISNLQFTIFSRKIWIVIIVSALIFILKGCGGREWEERHVNYHAPNWTSDGKIIFFEEIWIQKLKESISGPEVIEETQNYTMYEVDDNGANYEEIEEISSSARGFFSMVGSSSAGNYVVFGLSNIANNDNEIWVIGRDGTGLQEVGEGRYPDFSHDASQIVYEKPDEGIWIMDRDGENDHQIISDADAKYPAWSPDDTLIAYGDWEINVVNLNGDSVKSYQSLVFLDWGPIDSNFVLCQPYYGLPILLDIISDLVVDSLEFGAEKWSSDGNYFIGHDEGGDYVINRDGTNKWYLQP